MRFFVLLTMSLALPFACSATAVSQPLPDQRPHPDSLRLSAGPAWHRTQSPHFVIYSEAAGPTALVLRDSLEEAWTHANALLGRSTPDTVVVTVFVTASRTRFPRLMSPVTKGLMGRSPDGRDVIVLVQNDSVRAYTRHEVMHAVAARVWGDGPLTSGAWMREGLATFADSLCQGVPISIVARDVLRARPFLTLEQVTTAFAALHSTSRGEAYVLVGSLVDFLWSVRGRDGVKRLWTSEDSLVPALLRPSPLGAPGSTPDLLASWRAYTERVARGRPGLSMELLHRHGCG